MTEQSPAATPADVAFAPGWPHGVVLAMMSWLTVIASGILSPVLPKIAALAVKCLLTMVITLSIAVLVIHRAFLFTERGVRDSGVLGLAIGASATGIAVGAAAGGILTRASPRIMMSLGYALIAVGFILVSLPLSVTLTMLAAVPVGLGCGLATPALLGATFAQARESNMGIVSGLYTAAIFVGQFASTPVIVWLKSTLGSLSGAILVLGLFAVAVSALVFTTGIGSQSRPATERAPATLSS